MFSFFKKNGQQIQFKISGMHCVSCAMNIDGAVEDLQGVFRSHTNYAKQTTVVFCDPVKISAEKIQSEIAKQGYVAELE